MILIKRYPNRKLYNTEAKQYVTLEGIAELIRQGQEVQITDHQTGEDLTAVTLTQIIFEQEK
ncbi:MAG: polyhydroxyalkanoate synthesis regulator DNA-binding domain-containing protein, partial [Chloroflexota bacterium]